METTSIKMFYLLVKHRFGLTTITWLLAVITALSLSSQTIFSLLVLGNLVQGVLFALLRLAISLLCFRNVNLQDKVLETKYQVEIKFEATYATKANYILPSPITSKTLGFSARCYIMHLNLDRIQHIHVNQET